MVTGLREEKASQFQAKVLFIQRVNVVSDCVYFVTLHVSMRVSVKLKPDLPLQISEIKLTCLSLI